ncbi:MAG: hypothetical protein G3M78_11230 [Candidatus Nitrohelix vancouverensis]|uniref:Uncharacterized protein n=1 Tax=Candidatus Nitrohelix vancouverensis TaxID=2705534 RepID=A0A7T0C3R5_9BACT|nr:MAG: hypothetical protein G3M78_11230 [Candidatus Nitrohelix vancouverensis]
MKPQDYILFSGGVKGAEAEFGSQAEAFGVQEVNFTFEGHQIARSRGVRVLTKDELLNGDVSLSYLSKLMNRSFKQGPLMKKVLQSIWHQVNNAEEIFVVGHILEDLTVKGGTGWGAEFAKICNKTLYTFDQEEKEWFKWDASKWKKAQAKIRKKCFAGTGTRFLNPHGKKAIKELFEHSFNK